MTQRTAAQHEPCELAYTDADDLLNIVHYRAASKSRPGHWNVVGLDVLTGHTFCDCRASETMHECWHQTLAQAAWDSHPARLLARRYNDQQLTTAGEKASRMCRVYRRRTWRVLPDDQLALLACRSEYADRRGAREAREAAVAATAAA